MSGFAESALASSMSALPPKADMRGAATDVRFGPIADIASRLFDHLEKARTEQLPHKSDCLHAKRDGARVWS
jgi:hypothetical protein